jgi:16S rRNA (cytosine967-C5)-methyltransferase
MTPSARLAAAIDIVADIEARRRPAAEALKDWGLAHRFAGSGDRAALASLVYDALRRKASSGWIMQDNTPRAMVLGMLHLQRGLSLDAISALLDGQRFAPLPLSDQEQLYLGTNTLDDAPIHIAGDCPEWIVPSLIATYGADTLNHLQTLTQRAPLDIRVNSLKATRETVQTALQHLAPIHTPHSSQGLRFPANEQGRGPSLQTEPEFLQGYFEIQDEGSQLAAQMAGVQPSETVMDLCAGAGGKTLSLAAFMHNQGVLHATDADGRRLAPLYERLTRAGVTIANVHHPRGGQDPVIALKNQMDAVLVDAPCTGSGTWRRHPDTKWRLRPGSLSLRVAEQAAVLARAAQLVRSNGRIIYVTCSMFEQENDGAINAFLGKHQGFQVLAQKNVLQQAGLEALAPLLHLTRHGLQLTPLLTGTDGFYVAVVRKIS